MKENQATNGASTNKLKRKPVINFGAMVADEDGRIQMPPKLSHTMNIAGNEGWITIPLSQEMVKENETAR